MKRVISIILIMTLIFTMVGCGQTEDKSSITEVKVTIPCSTGTRAIVEGEAVIATQAYLLARAYFEKLETYNMDSFDAQEYSKLLAEATEAFRIAEAFSDSLEMHAGALEEIEKNDSAQQEKARYELLSMFTDSTLYSPFVTVAYAAEEKSPAEKYAEELTKTFDNAKNGQKLKAVAEKYGTDIKKAKIMLEQAQAILEGAAYEDQADFENKCYEAAVETKAAASAIGFGVAVAASGGIAAGGASATGIIEAGGLVMNGVSAVIDMGTAVTIHATNGEGNEYTAAWEKTAEMLAPVNAVFAIGGGIQNIKDFRDPEKAKDMVNNAAQAFLTGIGFARDYIQDGTVLGVSSNIINGYREIIVRSSDTSDPKAAKEVLLKTGISEETLNNDGSSAQQTQEAYLGTEADVYIEAMGELVDTEEPLDIDAFIENVDNAFRECAADEGAETEEVTEPATEPATEPVTEPESEPENSVSDPKESEESSDIAGVYSISELRFVQTDIAAPLDDRLHVTLNGTEITIEGETEFITEITGTYDAQSMTATFYADQTKMIVTFDGKGNLLYSSYNTNDGLLYIEIDASK